MTRMFGTFVLGFALMCAGPVSFAAAAGEAKPAADKPAEKKEAKAGCDKCNHGDKGHKCEKCDHAEKGHVCGKDCACGGHKK